MANQEHLKILKQGVEAWNKWREKKSEIKPELSGADLSYADLRGANLNDADLRGAGLSEAVLTGTNFIQANLSGAFLIGAKLSGADLRGANLNDANLNGADLSGAKLSGVILSLADLSWANLRDADLTGANLDYSDCRNTDLSGACLTGVFLRGIANYGWKIDAVQCDYIYRDKERYPESRNFKLGEFERFYQDHWDTLTIEFTRARFGQLTPIEYALEATLGTTYMVEKSEDRIVVKLESADQLQLALDAVVPVLAALESVSAGEVRELLLEPKDGGQEQLNGEELRLLLGYIICRLDEEHPPDRPKLSGPEEAFIEAVKSGPKGILAVVVRKWFEAGPKAGDFLNKVMFEIYRAYSRLFQAARGVVEMVRPETPKELPEPKKSDVNKEE